MSRKWIMALAAPALALCCGALIGESRAAAAQCPHEQATKTPAKVFEIGAQDCGLGLTIGSTFVGFRGPRCPLFRVVVPAHGECHGDAAPDRRCVPVGPLPVTLERCKCLHLGVPEWGVDLLACPCETQVNLGIVQDHATQSC